MSKIKQALLMLLPLTLLIGSCTSRAGKQVYLMKCIKPFQAFAYSGPDLHQEREIVLPPHPWQVEATVPIWRIEGYSLSSVDVEITRWDGEGEEIWLAGNLYWMDLTSGESSKNVFLIYKPELQKWEIVSADIGDSGLFVANLFVNSDRSVWGQTVWNILQDQPPAIEKIPTLSKFNENTRQFEFAKGAPEIPWQSFSYNSFPWPEIVLDKEGIFWLFVKNDGIYRYDPVAQRTERRASLSGLEVTDVALSPDGSIYFQVFRQEIYSKESFFRLIDGMLFRFLPTTGEIIPLDIPDQPWPIAGKILATHDGKLWLGAIGYREQDGNWRLIHPRPELFFVSAGDIYMMPPTLILESSDGILWYRKSTDDARADGTAWYDPRTGKGCMFTNMDANIVEDSEQRLWMVADGKLFKYQLSP